MFGKELLWNEREREWREREREREQKERVTVTRPVRIIDICISSFHSIFSHTHKHDERSNFNGKQTKIYFVGCFLLF